VCGVLLPLQLGLIEDGLSIVFGQGFVVFQSTIDGNRQLKLQRRIAYLLPEPPEGALIVLGLNLADQGVIESLQAQNHLVFVSYETEAWSEDILAELLEKRP
jgi:hypothetical protein